MAAPADLLAVGRVARAHGIRGRILVTPYNPESSGLERATALWLSREGAEPRRIEIERAERVHLGYLVALRGIADRDEADRLRGEEVRVARGELPALGEDEVYATDLVGLTVLDTAGARRGRVTALETAGRQELLAVRTDAGAEALVPLGLLREVREAEGEIVIEVPEGLFEVQEKLPG